MAYITRCVPFTDEILGGAGNLEFVYNTEQPLDVSMTVLAPGHPPVRWVLGRDVLARRLPGLHEVRVEADRDAVEINLTSPDGTAVMRVRRRDLDAFLRRTDRAVPFGSERVEFDADAELQELLQGGAR